MLHRGRTRQMQRLLPARRWSGLLVGEGCTTAVVPPPDAVPAVRHAGDGRDEETPVDVTAHGGSVERLAGVVRQVSFVRWLQVDEGPRWLQVPGLARRTFRNPTQVGLIVAVGALVTDNIHPWLVDKVVERPVHTVGVEGHRVAPAIFENLACDALPVARPSAVELGLRYEIPEDVMGVVASGDVTRQHDRLVLRQEIAAVTIGVLAGVQ